MTAAVSMRGHWKLSRTVDNQRMDTGYILCGLPPIEKHKIIKVARKFLQGYRFDN
jgi:hypothetical protein